MAHASSCFLPFPFSSLLLRTRKTQRSRLVPSSQLLCALVSTDIQKEVGRDASKKISRLDNKMEAHEETSKHHSKDTPHQNKNPNHYRNYLKRNHFKKGLNISDNPTDKGKTFISNK